MTEGRRDAETIVRARQTATLNERKYDLAPRNFAIQVHTAIRKAEREADQGEGAGDCA